MRFRRTEQIWMRSDENISSLCHLSKNLYNEANYLIRQEFFKTGRWIRFYELNKELKESKNYKSLPAQTAQQILRLLDKSWKSFFKAIKVWKKEPEKFKARPKLPKYKKKDAEHILVLTNQQCKIKEDGNLKFPKMLRLDVKTRLDKETNLREVRLIPKGVGYALEIVYEKEADPEDLDENKICGIDLGVRNLVTVGNNIGEKPIVVKGGICKSINQFYNKEMGRIQRIYESQKIKTGKKSKKLFDKRNRKIKDLMHKVSRFIIDYCVKKDIGTLVIGNNEDWKQNANIGKKNNQNFVQIPFYMLINQIKYKAEEKGINVILQEESHTSRCSFLDGESVEHHDQYLGKRFKRGLFRSAKGIIINADVQGVVGNLRFPYPKNLRFLRTLNIIKKAIPKAFAKVRADEIEGVGLHPLRCLV
ncbi:MAG: putative transposase [Candidatus Methanolliviera sp. GoM_oil]|nr:MAG: putative transposase [Candidatus Methanolliviera sp. GoM_oil]